VCNRPAEKFTASKRTCCSCRQGVRAVLLLLLALLTEFPEVAHLHAGKTQPNVNMPRLRRLAANIVPITHSIPKHLPAMHIAATQRAAASDLFQRFRHLQLK
jgi:hypothetical protein